MTSANGQPSSDGSGDQTMRPNSPSAPSPNSRPDAAALTATRRLKAAEYRGKALDALALADASTLARVRELHEIAAARWLTLAALSEGPKHLAEPV